ncbi:MAG TPA: alanine--tRNA ligase [bacterium]|nr:alanine--tRNA ligase [bacterium]
MRATEIRQTFLGYFADRGHAVVPSSSLLIKDDPSLLFTNAGMNQFKLVFLGQESRPYKTACSSQKCFRVSGKHNDLENVGVTPRHHTFFEMLGNFSFGDYFKEEAIGYAWEFLTRTIGLDKSRLWVTVFTTDDEAETLWKKIAPELKDRVLRFGEKENYWSMGDVGPCGPCSELHYDLGPQYGCGRPGCGVNCDCNRYLEIWNLVFMQFNRGADGTTVPLPKPSVDTGMGFERLAAVVQGKTSNYDSDLFQPIIRAIAEDCGVPYSTGEKGIPHRVCADHLRGLTFTIADGGMPGNEGAGYVLRRILRRAARHGKSLGYHGPFLHRFVDTVIDVMADAYPELRQRRDHIVHVIESEESRFAETLDAGLQRFEEVKKLAKNKVIPGVEAFKLYDTFGFPLDLTEVLAREAGLTVDEAGFEAALAEQRERSRAQTGFKDQSVSKAVGLGIESKFVYDATRLEAKILWVSDDNASIVLDQTPFYTESGGQIDDIGEIVAGNDLVFAVEWMEKADKAIVHHGHAVKGNPSEWIGKTVSAEVAAARRRMIQRNHTATHLLHKALHMYVGPHALQAGSLVAPDRLRFDFSNPGPLSREQLDNIETEVNRAILANYPVTPYITEYKKAIADGVTALFGEKYGDTVRVLKINDYSMELCGGTHVRSTGEIGLFRIASETGVAAGVRRIEAITGEAAYAKARADDDALKRAAELLKTSPDKLIERVEALLAEFKSLKSDLDKARKRLVEGNHQLQAEKLDGFDIHLLMPEPYDSLDEAKAVADAAKKRPEPTVAYITTSAGATLISSSAPKVLDAGQFLKSVAAARQGRGGGRADFAQGSIPPLSKAEVSQLLAAFLRGKTQG